MLNFSIHNGKYIISINPYSKTINHGIEAIAYFAVLASALSFTRAADNLALRGTIAPGDLLNDCSKLHE